MNANNRDEVEAMADILADYLSDAGYKAQSLGFESYSDPILVTAKKGVVEVGVSVDILKGERKFWFKGYWKNKSRKGAFTMRGTGRPKSDAKAVVDLVKGLPKK